MRFLRKWNDQPVWVDRLWLLGVYAIIFAFGMQFGCLRKERLGMAETRALRDVATLAVRGLGECVTQLNGMGQAATVLAGTERGYSRWQAAALRRRQQRPSLQP